MKYFGVLVISIAALVVLTRSQPLQPLLPSDCGDENEEWTQCGTACPETCLNQHVQNRMCVMVCRVGCFCKSGFIRQGQDARGGLGRCVPVHTCSPTNATTDN